MRHDLRPPVPVDHGGLCVDALAASGLRAVVVTPAHQFPTGVVLQPDRRHELLDWARNTSSLVIEDDYDAEFRYDRTPVGAIQGLGPDVVAYGGSVSKILAPGLRIGWLVLPEHLVSAVTDAKYATDLATGVVDQVTLADFLASGEMDRHIRRMAARYRTQRDHLVAALTTYLPEWTTAGTSAGLHLVVDLPAGHDDTILAAHAQLCGLDARPLSGYTINPPHRAGLVIGYAHHGADHRNHRSDCVPATCPCAWSIDETGNLAATWARLGRPIKAIVADNGPEYIATRFADALARAEITPINIPAQNPHGAGKMRTATRSATCVQ